MRCYSRKVGKDTDFTFGKILEKQRVRLFGLTRCFLLDFFMLDFVFAQRLALSANDG